MNPDLEADCVEWHLARVRKVHRLQVRLLVQKTVPVVELPTSFLFDVGNPVVQPVKPEKGKLIKNTHKTDTLYCPVGHT